MITRRKALIVLAAPALVLPYRRLLRSGYDNTLWFPQYLNRPVYNRPAREVAEWFGIRPANAASNTLSWIGPAITGGPSSSNAAGPSTTTDIAQTLTLGAPTASTVTSSSSGQVFVGLNIQGPTTCVQINHANCKILRSYLAPSGGGFPQQCVALGSGGTGLLIEDCHLNANASSDIQNQNVNTGSCATPAYIIRRCHMERSEKNIGVNHTNSLGIDNWITNIVGGDSDMFQVYQSGAAANNTNFTIQHNTFDGLNNTTYPSAQMDSNVNMSNYPSGNISTVTFTANACMMSINSGNSPHQVLMDQHFSSGTISGIVITNNGFYGPSPYKEATGTVGYTSSGNYVMTTPYATSGSPTNGTGQI